MTTALLAAAVLAGLACPAHMWWRMRRHETTACCPTSGADDPTTRALRERQRELGARIAELDRAATGHSAAARAVTLSP